MQLFSLFGRIMIEDDAAQKSLQNIDKQAENTGKGFGKLGALATSLGAAVATAGATAVASLAVLGGTVAKTGIQYNAMAEQSEVAWKTLLGTQEEAQDMMKRISDFTKATPFETESVDKMAKYMHNAGLEGQGLFDELMKVSDVASAFAIPASEAEEMARQMSQVRQAGVAYTEDLNILQDRGVPIYKAIADQLGITTGEVKNMASEGKLSSEIYLNAFNNVAKGVEGASQAQAGTFLGMISTLSDNFKLLSGTIMEPFFNLMKSWMPVVIGLVEGLTSAFEQNGWKGVMAELLPPDVYNFLASAFGTIKQIVTDSLGRSKDAALFLWGFFKDNLLPILTSLYEWIQGHMPVIRNTAETVFNKIREVASMVWSFFLNNILPILERFYGFIQSKMPQIQSIIENVFSIISNVVKIAWNIFENLLLPVLKALWDYIAAPAFAKIQTIIEKVFGAIFDAVDKVVGVFDDVVSAIQKAMDWLTFWDNKKVSKKTIEVEEKRTTTNTGILGKIPGHAKSTVYSAAGVTMAKGDKKKINFDVVKDLFLGEGGLQFA